MVKCEKEYYRFYPLGRVLKKILGPKKDEIKGTRQDCNNEGLYDLYSSPNINRVATSKIIRWAWHEARIGERRGACRVLVGGPEGKTALRRPRRRWENTIKMDLQEMEWVYGLD